MTITLRIFLFVVSIILFYVSFVFVYRFFTLDFFSSFLDSVGNIGVPSFVTAIVAFISFFIAPPNLKQQVRMYGKKIVSSFKLCIVLLILGICFLSMSYFFVNYFVPLNWSKFIDTAFLKGEQDSYKTALVKTSEIKKMAPLSGKIIEEGINVFLLRQQTNHETRSLVITKLRKLIQFLEKDIDKNKYVANFQRFSLGEAYSLAMKIQAYEVSEARNKANFYYDEFLSNSKGVATNKFLQSAYLNKANIYMYSQDYRKAAEQWEKLEDSASKFVNLTSAYVMLEDYDNALKQADLGIEYIESKGNSERGNYDAIVENKMIVFLSKNESLQAITTFKESFSGRYIPSGSVESTYALALLISNKFDDFKLIMRENNQISEEYSNLLYGIYYLQQGDIQSSKLKFKKYLNIDENENVTFSEVLMSVTNNLDKLGYFKNDSLRRLLLESES